MEMTFDEYIINPMGIRNSVYSNRHVYRELYTKKLNLILLRETGKIKYHLYKTKNEYYVYMKIPSEVIKNFYYDVVIKFYTDKPELEHSTTLSKYYVKFYSNDPAFVFTFAYAMNKNNLFIKDLAPRMSKYALTHSAQEKNPKSEIGYVKSLYFAYLLMRQYNLFDKTLFIANSDKYDRKVLLDQIENADEKIKARQDAAEKLQKEKKINKKKEINKSNVKQQPSNSNYDSTVRVKHTKTINFTKRTNKTKFVKNTKKI